MKLFKLMRSLLILILIICTNCGISTLDQRLNGNCDVLKTEIIENDIFFNTQFLSSYDLVAQTLINEEGFQEVFFQSSDGIQLNGLFRKKINAPFSIIFCAGFYPGRKEGLATFIKMVPDTVNILFFDARGHGKSDGRFFTNIYNYGLDEYKDIIGALDFVYNETAGLPIFIHAICAGAFHTTKALAHIDINTYHIKGFIFDSGLTSVLNACTVPEKHFKEKIIPSLLVSLYKKDSKQQIKERYLCKALCAITGSIIKIATALVKPRLEKIESENTLTHIINTITCPILFIHSQDDAYCPIANIMALAENATHKTCWWITQKSEHALHHIKHKQEYHSHINAFLNLMHV